MKNKIPIMVVSFLAGIALYLFVREYRHVKEQMKLAGVGGTPYAPQFNGLNGANTLPLPSNYTISVNSGWNGSITVLYSGRVPEHFQMTLVDVNSPVPLARTISYELK